MFARTAKSPDVDRRHRVSALVPPAFANDDRFHRRLVDVMGQPRQQALLCRWRASPVTGKLECHWEVGQAEPRWPLRLESVGEPAKAPAPSWPMGGRRAARPVLRWENRNEHGRAT